MKEREQTRKKREHVSLAPISAAYWMLATALYLILLLSADSRGAWGGSWIVWPIAGVLFVPVRIVCAALLRRRK